MTQLILNNGTAIVTEESAFYANFGQHPQLFNIPKELSEAEIIK